MFVKYCVVSGSNLMITSTQNIQASPSGVIGTLAIDTFDFIKLILLTIYLQSNIHYDIKQFKLTIVIDC